MIIHCIGEEKEEEEEKFHQNSSAINSLLMDTANPWPQELGLMKPMESSSNNNVNTSNLIIARPQELMVERRARPQKEQALNCPRCNSTNTKFCYYNNYSLTQPRYFCKTCRRYWTEGGSLRNVPVGGGSRKNKKVASSSNSTTTTGISSPSTTTTTTSKQNPSQDLNLAFSTNATTNPSSAMDLLKGAGGMMMNPFMPMHSMPLVQDYQSGFGLHDFRANTLSFPLDGISGNGQSGRIFFPFEETRQVSSSNNNTNGGNHFEQNKGFWNGMMGGGSW